MKAMKIGENIQEKVLQKWKNSTRRASGDEKNYPRKNVGRDWELKKITTFGDPNNYFEVFAEIFPGFHVIFEECERERGE